MRKEDKKRVDEYMVMLSADINNVSCSRKVDPCGSDAMGYLPPTNDEVEVMIPSNGPFESKAQIQSMNNRRKQPGKKGALGAVKYKPGGYNK